MLERFLIKDTSGKKSLTATAFILGFIIVNCKLILSGFAFGKFTFSQFSGVDYAAAITALGAIYVLRRNKLETPDAK